MKATLTVNMDNSAFEENPHEELARILEGLARSLRGYPCRDRSWGLRDANGNTVGIMEIEGAI